MSTLYGVKRIRLSDGHEEWLRDFDGKPLAVAQSSCAQHVADSLPQYDAGEKYRYEVRVANPLHWCVTVHYAVEAVDAGEARSQIKPFMSKDDIGYGVRMATVVGAEESEMIGGPSMRIGWPVTLGGGKNFAEGTSKFKAFVTCVGCASVHDMHGHTAWTAAEKAGWRRAGSEWRCGPCGDTVRAEQP